MKRDLMTATMTAMVLLAGAAQADGVLLSPQALPQATRTQLADEIARAKKARPESFTQVQGLAATVKTWDARKRGRIAPVGPVFKRVGANAFWPMVELIAFAAPARGDEPESATLALQVGLIEAAGAARDARLAPVWTAILNQQALRFELARASVEALAKLDSDAVAAQLVTLSKSQGVKRDAALAAMGNCRRLVVAKALAVELAAKPDPATARRVARSLSDVGNSWAWKTPSVLARSEEGAVRQLAAEALLGAYLAYDGEVRQAASNALLVVNAPGTPTLIDGAKKAADEKQLAALDSLAKRWAQNPLR